MLDEGLYLLIDGNSSDLYQELVWMIYTRSLSPKKSCKTNSPKLSIKLTTSLGKCIENDGFGIYSTSKLKAIVVNQNRS